MENFEIIITDNRNGQITKLTANDIVMHLGKKDDDNQLVVMGSVDFVQLLYKEGMINDKAIACMFTEYFANNEKAKLSQRKA